MLPPAPPDEYFNQWDAYDVDGELSKLEGKAAEAEEAAPAEAKQDDGLPPDLTAERLARMPAVEVISRPPPPPPNTLEARLRAASRCRRADTTCYALPGPWHTRARRSRRMASCTGLVPTHARASHAASSQVERRALAEKQKGNEAYKASEYRTALTHYTHSLRLQQNNHVVYANRGMCYLKLKQYRQCLSDCTAAIQIDDGYTKAYLRRGIAHRRLSQTRQALKDLDIVLTREPHNKEAAEHQRCAKLEVEKLVREERERAEAAPVVQLGGAKKGKSSVVIEEVEGDSDEDEAASGGGATAAQMRKVREEAEAADARERERAERAERLGRERPGPMVDPQALQDSSELMASLQKMGGGGSLLTAAADAQARREKEAKPPTKEKRRVTIEESDDDDDAPPVVRDGFEPANRFAGARPGWVFKKGVDGLGYYRDAKAARAAPAPKKAAMRKLAVEESDDEEEVEVKKAPPKPAAAPPKASMRKMAIVEDDDDDEISPAPTGGMRKTAIEEDDDEEDEDAACAPPPTEAPLDAAAAAALQIADAIRLAGNDLFNSSQYEDAIGKYSEALDRLVGSSRAASGLAVKCLNNRAACCCQLQQYRSAIRDCSDVLERSSNDAKALMRRAFCYEAIERYTEALADMRRVVALEPSSHASAACIRLQKFAQQSASLQQAEKAAPTPAKGTKTAAATATAAKPTPSRPATAPAAKPAPPTPAVTAPPASKPAAGASTSRGSDAEVRAADAKERGTAALRRGEFRDAAAAYHEACKLQPNVHTHFSNLSLALLKLGQPEHAVTAARRCTELAPAFGKGHFRLGQALRAKGDASGGVDALTEALRQTQASGGKEAAEIARELAACREEAAKGAEAAKVPAAAAPAAPAAPKGGGATSEATSAAGAPSGKVVDVTDAPAKAAAGGGGASPTSLPKGGAVSQERAAAVAKRAAELAAKVGNVGGATTTQAAATLSAFERRFDAVWARGKGADDTGALREVLGLLPAASAGELGKFVREGLTEELLSALVLATSKASEPAATAAARIVHLSTVRRFDMAWLFVGKAEKAAVAQILGAAVGCADVDAAGLAAAAKRYGVELP